VAKLAVIRIRGSVNVRRKVSDTMRMLGLTRVNHCVVIDDTSPYQGMLRIAKDMLTWGEIDPKMLEQLLRKRGRLIGDKRLTDEYIKSQTPFSSIGEFAKAVCTDQIELKTLPGLKKVFRLHPPRRGYKSIKRPFRDLGDLGYRGDRINDLILRMI
jgi:large subunit ribosomal protein L30